MRYAGPGFRNRSIGQLIVSPGFQHHTYPLTINASNCAFENSHFKTIAFLYTTRTDEQKQQVLKKQNAAMATYMCIALDYYHDVMGVPSTVLWAHKLYKTDKTTKKPWQAQTLAPLLSAFNDKLKQSPSDIPHQTKTIDQFKYNSIGAF